MTHQVMISAAKPDYLDSVLGKHMVEREGPLRLSSDLQNVYLENSHIHMHALINTK